MNDGPPDAYCFFQEIEPQPPLVGSFDRDYLLHAVKGSLKVEVEGFCWVLPRSFAAWVPSNTKIKVELNKPVTSCSILSKPGFVTGLPRQPITFQMSRLTREMALHCREWGKDALHPPEAEVFFKALLSTCVGLVDSSIDLTRPSSDDPQIARAIAYLELNFDQTITTETLANICHLSVRTLQRRFISELGESWRQTLARLRMISAVECLTDESLSIIQIASKCGYSSTSTFNQNFKAFTSVTPSEFRKRLS